jgi:hypothetical protein
MRYIDNHAAAAEPFVVKRQISAAPIAPSPASEADVREIRARYSAKARAAELAMWIEFLGTRTSPVVSRDDLIAMFVERQRTLTLDDE